LGTAALGPTALDILEGDGNPMKKIHGGVGKKMAALRRESKAASGGGVRRKRKGLSDHQVQLQELMGSNEVGKRRWTYRRAPPGGLGKLLGRDPGVL